MSEQVIYTAAEAAEVLGVTPQNIYAWLRLGILRVHSYRPLIQILHDDMASELRRNISRIRSPYLHAKVTRWLKNQSSQTLAPKMVTYQKGRVGPGPHKAVPLDPPTAVEPPKAAGVMVDIKLDCYTAGDAGWEHWHEAAARAAAKVRDAVVSEYGRQLAKRGEVA